MARSPNHTPDSLPAWRVEIVVLGQGTAQEDTVAALLAATQRSIEASTPPCAQLRAVLRQPAPVPFVGEALIIGVDIQSENGVHPWRNAHHMRAWSTLHHHYPHACVIFVYRHRQVAFDVVGQSLMHVRVHPPVPLNRGQGVEASLSAPQLRPYGLACDHGPVAWAPSHLGKLLEAAHEDVGDDVRASVAFLRQQHLGGVLIESVPSPSTDRSRL